MEHPKLNIWRVFTTSITGDPDDVATELGFARGDPERVKEHFAPLKQGELVLVREEVVDLTQDPPSLKGEEWI